ncbi:MAG: helix-turn-helix domain-containing protein [Candidatus Margulisbacteria bacterium]|jgi:transcriptional regulator with XRE-family HTH domain|nr:helix-turn-helix domain-containing protein [Candidatus Margulisiibacteriota bacterium]
MSIGKYPRKAELGLKYDSIDVGLYLKKLRLARDLSIYQLAYKAGLRESVIMRIEKGQREPRLNTLLKIIEGLELTPARFWRVFD